MLKGVIFDMDGVIIDSEPIHYKIFKKYTSEMGLDIPDDEYGKFIGSTNPVMYAFLKEKYKLSQSLEELINTYEERCFNYIFSEENEKPIDGVDVLIKELYKNNLKLAVASSSPIKAINAVVEHFKIDKYFDKLVSGGELKNAKPAPDIFLTASKRLGLNPSECAVVEDSKNGVLAAKAAGMKCIGYRNVNSGNQDISSADIIIDSFHDINFRRIEVLF